MSLALPNQETLLGIGVDLVALPRFSEFLRRNQDQLGEVFTAGELAAAGRQRRDLYLATRWALKEASLKALGTGWTSGVQWTEVEALGDLFTPHISLQGMARRVADSHGPASLVGSAGHAGDCVIAVVALMLAAGSRVTGEVP